MDERAEKKYGIYFPVCERFRTNYPGALEKNKYVLSLRLG